MHSICRHAAVLGVAIAAVVAGCGGSKPDDAPKLTSPNVAPIIRAAVPRPVPLVRWDGPIEHLFFHTLVIKRELAFRDDAPGRGIRDFFVTTGEFKSILHRMYANGWTLVDLHRAVENRVRVPRGRRPFVMSEDDVNYYDYTRGRGLGQRLVLDAAGDVAVEERDGRGRRVTNNDLVPIVDQFVEEHPLFSADGAKGVLALTGYEGLFGERIQQPGPDQAAARRRARAVAARLRATGWKFASHTYGHIDLARSSAAVVQQDSDRWARLAWPIIGRTDVLIYPFGARPPDGSETARVLQRAGFKIQCDIDVGARMVRGEVSYMSRRHIDGLALYGQEEGLRPFFSARLVRGR